MGIFEDKYKKLKEVVESYKNLNTNWDGYDGEPPNVDEVDEMLRLLDELEKNDIPAPNHQLDGSSTVGLYWASGDVWMELEVESSLTYFVVREHNSIWSQEEGLSLNDTILLVDEWLGC
jgi:cytochrome oxidase Cu insertion factor (SCO1/SenC/PrrC family)